MTSTEQKILAIVKREGVVSSRLIANELRITPNYAEYLCKYLVKEGCLKYRGGGQFKLVPRGQNKKAGEINPEPRLYRRGFGGFRSAKKQMHSTWFGVKNRIADFVGEKISKEKIKDNFMKLFKEINKRWEKRWSRKKKKG